MQYTEINFDGLVGPTHNYAGLSYGNVASLNNANSVSNPKAAAKQGLQKMKALHDLGLTQGVLAPQERPDIATLKRLGFQGKDTTILEQAMRQAPEVFQAVCSASSMWTANAATVSPSTDTADGKVHFTPANLTNKFHRSIEPEVTGRILQATFPDSQYFKHHTHLPENDHFGDEGAANHTRFCSEYGTPGIEMFVYGRSAFKGSQPAPKKFPARQTQEASQAVARLHQLAPERTLFVQQNPEVIEQGVFHNDVIAVGNKNVHFYHQAAFLDTPAMQAALASQIETMHFIEVPSEQVSVAEAVKTYMFNTQLVSLGDHKMVVIAPTECAESPAVKAYFDWLITQNTPIKDVYYYDVKQSMRNGGGPACLRLRVCVNTQEQAALNQQCLLNDALFNTLNQWIDTHYRDRLNINDLADPALLIETRTALDQLTQILNLGSVYPFQR